MQKPLYSELLQYIPSTHMQPWSELYLTEWLSYTQSHYQVSYMPNGHGNKIQLSSQKGWN